MAGFWKLNATLFGEQDFRDQSDSGDVALDRVDLDAMLIKKTKL